MTKEIIFFDGFPIETFGNDNEIINFYRFPIETFGNVIFDNGLLRSARNDGNTANLNLFGLLDKILHLDSFFI